VIKGARLSEAQSSGTCSALSFALDALGQVRCVAETQECWWLVEATSRLGFTVRAGSPL
jgi:hypothetical protein